MERYVIYLFIFKLLNASGLSQFICSFCEWYAYHQTQISTLCELYFFFIVQCGNSKLNNSGAPRARERSPIPKKMWYSTTELWIAAAGCYKIDWGGPRKAVPENFRTLQAHKCLTLKAVLMSAWVKCLHSCMWEEFWWIRLFFVHGMPFFLITIFVSFF